jgi:predicted nucleotidyltransferase
MNQEIDIEELKKEIKKRLEPLNLEKVILFGSYAYGNPNKDSDIDLYVVTKDEFLPKSWRDKRELTRNISKHLRDIREEFGIDLIVHTKKMYEKFIEFNKPFAKEIFKGISL